MKRFSKIIIIMGICLLIFSGISNLQNALYFSDITRNIDYTRVTNLSTNESIITYETARYQKYNEEIIPEEIRTLNFYDDNNVLLFKLIITNDNSIIGISINNETIFYKIL